VGLGAIVVAVRRAATTSRHRRRPSWRPRPSLLRGLGYAAVLLLVSYEGWVPVARILPPLREHTTGGRWTVIAGHAVYSATLGLIVRD
jgi:hypothetical protein